MAASGTTSVSLYHSSTPSATPPAGNLVNGELAINIADGKLFYKDNLGVVKEISGAGGGGNTTTFGLYENNATISANYTISNGNNAISAGPVTVNSGVIVTVPSGSTWTVT